jgi:hypothetical protein
MSFCIQVKAIDKSLVIEGFQEEENEEFGLVERHFTRRYTVPGVTETETTSECIKIFRKSICARPVPC